jgi:acyl-CoA synthetase (NDP forming)
VSVSSVDEMVDMTAAFRFLGVPSGKGVAVVGGGGGFSVHAADEIDEAGLECPVLPDDVQAALSEFTPAAGTSVRNPVDTMATYDPPSLERTIALVGGAPNIHTVMFHASVSLGAGRRASRGMGGFNPEQLVDMIVDQIMRGRDASGTSVAVVLRPPLDVEGMQRASVLQEKLWRAGFPVFPSIPRAANAIAKLIRWHERRER